MALSAAERARRRRQARRVLLPAAIRAAGRKGFYATAIALARHPDKVSNPIRLAGWLKAQARKRGWLRPEHRYGPRRSKKVRRLRQRFLRAMRKARISVRRQK